MAGYGAPQILDHMNPEFRRAMAINELVGADTMRSTAAAAAAARAGDNRPMMAPALDDKPQPIARKRRGGSRRACNECKQQKVYI